MFPWPPPGGSFCPFAPSRNRSPRLLPAARSPTLAGPTAIVPPIFAAMKIPLAPSPRHFSLPFLLALAATGPAFAAAPALRDAVQAKLDAEYSSLEAIYKNLHAHPELSFMEFQTAALVAAELRALGFAVTEKVGITGVVGVLKNGSGPTLLIRADMDGLELTERGDLSYRSQNDGVMHACGHDGHMAMVLGAAARLADRRRPR